MYERLQKRLWAFPVFLSSIPLVFSLLGIAAELGIVTAVQLIFPLVLFIFPGIFVVLVGPAAISMYREMFAVMGNH